MASGEGAGERTGSRIGERIRDARQSCTPVDGSSPTQKWLASVTVPPRQPQQISRIERGDELPSVPTLIEIYRALRGPATGLETDPDELAGWVVDLLAGKTDTDRDEDSLVAETLSVLEARLRRRGRSGPLTSLADFPGDAPLTVVLGDRREPRAKTAADCLIYSGSTTDPMYLLPYLGQHADRTVIRSDKLLVRMPNDFLAAMPEFAESNLLIVGSPAANWGARILNENDAVFPFRIDDDVVSRDAEFRADDRLQDDSFASMFWELATSAEAVEGGIRLDDRVVRQDAINRGDDERLVDDAADLVRRVLNGSTAKTVMNRFRSLGILDVADQENHGVVGYASNDFAVVTLARNPWSRDGRHRAVICGGIHGPGTASALRELLARPERFRNHPLGAVLEVKIRLDLDWPTRFERASVSFQTRTHRSETVLEHIDEALAVPVADRLPFFRLFNDDALRSRAEFLRGLLAQTE